MDEDLLTEFLDKRVDKSFDCWLWTGSIHRSGYGIFGWKGKKNISAHKFIYENLVGKVPKGLELDHLCRVRNCVNPQHLEPVTHQENMARGKHATKTHCPKGHEYSAENTRLYKGKRNCKACHKVVANQARDTRRRLAHGF